jgi:hypothetical protein
MEYSWAPWTLIHEKKPKLKISCQTPFRVIGIHNALPCSRIVEAHGYKQKTFFEDQIKKLHFLCEKSDCITKKVKKYTGYLYINAKNVKVLI